MVNVKDQGRNESTGEGAVEEVEGREKEMDERGVLMAKG
jgi:hypothetical protein